MSATSRLGTHGLHGWRGRLVATEPSTAPGGEKPSRTLENLSLIIELPERLGFGTKSIEADGIQVELYQAQKKLSILQFPEIQMEGSFIFFEIALAGAIIVWPETVDENDVAGLDLLLQTTVKPQAFIDQSNGVDKSLLLANVRTWCTIPYETLPPDTKLKLRTVPNEKNLYQINALRCSVERVLGDSCHTINPSDQDSVETAQSSNSMSSYDARAIMTVVSEETTAESSERIAVKEAKYQTWLPDEQTAAAQPSMTTGMSNVRERDKQHGHSSGRGAGDRGRGSRRLARGRGRGTRREGKDKSGGDGRVGQYQLHPVRPPVRYRGARGHHFIPRDNNSYHVRQWHAFANEENLTQNTAEFAQSLDRDNSIDSHARNVREAWHQKERQTRYKPVCSDLAEYSVTISDFCSHSRDEGHKSTTKLSPVIDRQGGHLSDSTNTGNHHKDAEILYESAKLIDIFQILRNSSRSSGLPEAKEGTKKPELLSGGALFQSNKPMTLEDVLHHAKQH